MAVEQISNHQRFFGIVGDVKPTDSSVLNGSEYREFSLDNKTFGRYRYYKGVWYLEGTQIVDSSGSEIDVQNPFPTNGDSVYSKDVNISGSDKGTFSGDITSLVDDLDTTFSSTGHSSPANFTIKLKRPILNAGIKFCSPEGKNFSNTKITLKDRSESILLTIDESLNNTDKTSEEYFWPQIAWCSIKVEFYTTDDIDLNWTILEKSISVHTVHKFVDKDKNSTVTPLIANDTWQGEWIRTNEFVQAVIDVITDQVSASGGLLIELKTTIGGTEAIHTHEFDVLENTPGGHHYPTELEGEEMRVSYTNGATGQGTFKLVTTLFDTMVEEGHAHNVDYSFRSDHPAPIFRAIQTGFKPNGVSVNASYTTGGNPKTSVEEYDDSVNPVRKNLEGVGDIIIGVTQVEIVVVGTPTYTIRIQADSTNTGIIYIGKIGVLADGSNDFVRLEAGDEIWMNYEDTGNALYAISNVASQIINVGALL